MSGTSMSDGQTTNSLNKKSCDRLRCLDCDKRVVKYANCKWKDSVNYLFVRNYILNAPKLQTGLEADAGSCAYACQCKWKV
mmetsp:Transcript_35929/g.26685  ORF Transcript_35929/g.26685 Transcript_35929/m.26685 type:complete len:81 (+) Transcript_35929:434-676(+)